jgi:cleavage and polyadenylation specificity factor subunit 2
MLRVTPIYGSRWEEQGSATLGSCTLVEYAGVRVLVNVGGPFTAVVQAGDGGEEERTMPPLPDHDCLLLTDSTLEHMGNLPLYCKQQRQLQQQQQQQQMIDEDDGHVTMPPLKPIYATFPTVKMGQMALYDYHANLCLDGGCPPFTLEEMDSAIAQLQTIKYSQTIHLPLDNDLGGVNNTSRNTKGKNYKKPKPQLAITAHRAGHVVGGAFYVMQRVQDETAVVMTATYHIAKELHLESSTLLQHGATPDVLITHPGGPAMKWLSQLYTPPPKAVSVGKNKKTIANKQQPKLLKPLLVAQAERNVTEHVMSVLRRDGNVLLPVDASGRVLELVLLLSQHWDRQRLQGTYNLIWLGPMVPNILEFSRSQLEWMNGTLGNQFDSPSFGGGGGGGGGKNATGPKGAGGGGFSGGGHPYMLKSVQRCTSIEQVQAIMEDNGNPTCVLATGLSLDHGPARDMLLQWADNDNNSILFTNSSQCQARPWVQNNKWRQQNAGGVSSGMDFTASTTTLNTLASSEAEAMAVTASVNSAAAAASAATVAGVTTTVVSGTTTVDVTEDGATTAVIEDHANVLVGEALSNDQDLSEYTTSYQLLYQWAKAQWEGREMEDSITVDVLVPHRSALKGAELKQFLDQEEAARVSKRKLEQERAMLREVELAKGRLRLGEAEGTTTTNTGTTTSTSLSADGASKSDGTKGAMVKSPMASTRPKKKNRFDSTLFLKFSKPLHCTLCLLLFSLPCWWGLNSH